MKKIQLLQDKPLQEYIDTIVYHAYPDLSGCRIQGVWKRISAFAQVSLSSSFFEVQCQHSVRNWPEPALLGLLAHELSHIALRDTEPDEENADMDTISRGLGPYLAVERIYVGKYLDHIVKKGKDRYVGYNKIRDSLNAHEITQLDLLLQRLGLTPSTE